MIHDASRRRVQPARSATIAGRATAVTMSSRPARKTPAPRTASSRNASRRGSGWAGAWVTRASVGAMRESSREPRRRPRAGFPRAYRPAVGSGDHARLVRHHLLSDRLIGPFLTQRRRKGRDVTHAAVAGAGAPRGVEASPAQSKGDGDADAASHVRTGREAQAGGQGGSGAGPRGPRAARRAARLQERSVRGPPQGPAGRDRGHPDAVVRGAPRLDRRPSRGRGAGRPRRTAQRRQVVGAPGAVRDPDPHRRLPVHDPAPGACAHAHRGRARPARRDPRPHRGRDRGPRRRPRAAGRAPERRRHRLLRPGGRRRRATSGRSWRRSPRPASRSRRSSRRRERTRRRPTRSTDLRAAFPELVVIGSACSTRRPSTPSVRRSGA